MLAPLRSRGAVVALLAAAALVVGYLDLARGGETVSATLLVVGYAALVPAAILLAAPRRVG